MFSGKTTTLVSLLFNLSRRDLKICYINSSLDTRSSDVASSHSDTFVFPKVIDGMKVSSLEDVDVSNYHVIGIDEGQFFKGLERCVIHWVNDLNKTVFIASLNGDKDMKVFGEIHNLIPFAESIIHIKADCYDCVRLNMVPIIGSQSAAFSHKLRGNTGQTESGGKDKYISVCRKHHLMRSMKTKVITKNDPVDSQEDVLLLTTEPSLIDVKRRIFLCSNEEISLLS
jgi:thymidine kinase